MPLYETDKDGKKKLVHQTKPAKPGQSKQAAASGTESANSKAATPTKKEEK